MCHLLAAYDEYLIGYKDRSDVLDPKHQAQAFNRYGLFHPVVLCNGRIIGNWKKCVKKGQVAVETSFFEPVPESVREACKAAAARFRDFLGTGCR